MASTEIDRPQISGGCPYKVLNSQWVPARPEVERQKWTTERDNVTYNCDTKYKYSPKNQGILGCDNRRSLSDTVSQQGDP